MTPDQIQTLIATAARLEAKLDGVTEDVGEVRALAAKTNGRVTALEKSRERDKGFLAAIALLMPLATAVASAWLVSTLF